MEKRVVITVVLCMALLIAWQYIFPPPKPTAPVRGDGGAAVVAKAGPETKAGTPTSPTAPAAGTPGAAAGTAGDAAKVEPKPAEELTTVETPLVRAVFSSYGATLKSWKLLYPQYKREEHGKLVPVDLIATQVGNQLKSEFYKSGFDVPADAVYKLEKKETKGGSQELLFSYDAPTVRVEKRYQIREKGDNAYRLALTVVVTNKGAKDVTENFRIGFAGFQDPKQGTGGMFSPPVQPRTAVCLVNGKVHREDVKDAIKGKRHDGRVLWAGIDEQYFLGAILPEKVADGKGTDRVCAINGTEAGVITTQVFFDEKTVSAGKSVEHPLTVFLGPKDIKLLEADGLKLEDTVDFGSWIWWLCRPMLFLLQLFFSWFHNWGIAIILLTITVKLLTLYWNQKSMMSMKAMSALAPKVNELKERYKDDKNKLNTEVMNLYKTNQVSPLGGCVPMLLQMPVYYALYRTLSQSVELYRVPFFGWLQDLSSRDPYYVLPLLLGATMFVQQKISPTPADSAQAKMMMYFMPLLFTFFMLFLPAGLTLYIMVNTLLGIAHQWYMNKAYEAKYGPTPPPTAQPPRGAKPARA